MSGLDLSIKILIESPSERALDALVDAIAHEPLPEVRATVFDRLIEKRWDLAAPRLVGSYARLDSSQKSKILERQDSLVPHLRKVLDEGSYDAKCNAIQIITDIGKTRLLHMLAPVFSGIDERLRRRAGLALLRTAQNYSALSGRLKPGDTAALAEAVARSRKDIFAVFAELFRSYKSHRESNILRGMLLLGEECHAMLMTAFDPGNERVAADLARILAENAVEHWDSMVALMYLSKDETIRHKADFVLKKREPQALRDALRKIFQLGEPKAVVDLAHWWGEPVWWKGVNESMDEFDASLQDRLLAVILDPRVNAEKSYPCLEKLTRSGTARIRRIAVAEITSRPKADVDSLSRFLKDPDEEVQLQTTRALLAFDDARREELVIRQLLSQYDSVRKVAAQEVSGYSFKAYMRAFDTLERKTRVLAASALTKINHNLEKELARALAGAEIETKIKALRIITVASPDEKMESDVIALASDANPFVRATAVAALGAFKSATARGAILAALNDPDSRVVANAIETLEFAGERNCLRVVKEFAHSTVPRIRANLVKCLYHFRDPEYRGLFLDMCAQADPAMLISAIWLARELHMPEAGVAMMRIIRGNAEEKVREKAADALAKIRSGGNPSDAKPGDEQ
jgi:HEAT repeat protein